MAKIAIMGFGTVGSGVLEVIRRNAAAISRRAGEPVEVKYILDVYSPLWTVSVSAARFFNASGRFARCRLCAALGSCFHAYYTRTAAAAQGLCRRTALVAFGGQICYK